MGLDQYLSAEKYVSGYDFRSDEEKEAGPTPELGKYRAVLEAGGLTEIASKSSPGASISCTVAYWRKANQVHDWFVTNVQGGVDECQRSYVSRDQLQELLATTMAALAAYETGDTVMAAETMPPTSGFFFGSTDVDEWYAQDLRDTITQIEPLLAEKYAGFDFYYQASW